MGTGRTIGKTTFVGILAARRLSERTRTAESEFCGSCVGYRLGKVCAMRFPFCLRWRPCVRAMLSAAVLSGPFTRVHADEPVPAVSPDQVVPSEDVPEVARIATAEQAPYSGGTAPAAPTPAANAPAPKPAPPPAPWKGLYFDNDFSYKKKPDHKHLL